MIFVEWLGLCCVLWDLNSQIVKLSLASRPRPTSKYIITRRTLNVKWDQVKWDQTKSIKWDQWDQIKWEKVKLANKEGIPSHGESAQVNVVPSVGPVLHQGNKQLSSAAGQQNYVLLSLHVLLLRWVRTFTSGVTAVSAPQNSLSCCHLGLLWLKVVPVEQSEANRWLKILLSDSTSELHPAPFSCNCERSWKPLPARVYKGSRPVANGGKSLQFCNIPGFTCCCHRLQIPPDFL